MLSLLLLLLLVLLMVVVAMVVVMVMATVCVCRLLMKVPPCLYPVFPCVLHYTQHQAVEDSCLVGLICWLL